MSVPPTVEQSLLSVAATAGGRDALADLAEIGLDAALQDGLLRDIPILGTLIRLVQTGRAVRDHLFVRKLARFLLALERTTPAERAAFIAAINTDEERQQLGEHLMLLLDRLDDMEKPALLARLFEAYLKRRIVLDQYRRLAAAVDRIHLSSLATLTAFYARPGGQVHSRDPEYPIMQELATAGLAQIELGGGYGGGEGCFIENDLGAALCSVLNDAT